MKTILERWNRFLNEGPESSGEFVDPPEKIIKYIRGLFEKAKQAYKPEGSAGKKSIRDIAKVMGISEDIMAVKVWPKIHQRFSNVLDAIQIKLAPTELLHMAVTHTRKDDTGYSRPTVIVLRSGRDWSGDLAERLPLSLKTPALVLQHEVEHAIEKAITYASFGKLEPVMIAIKSLDKVFDMSTTTGGLVDSWVNDPDEIYAEFRALRTRLGGQITKSDLDTLCKIQCEPLTNVPPERQISQLLIKKLRCNGCSFDNSKGGVDGANYFAGVRIDARGRGRTMVAEQETPANHEVKKYLQGHPYMEPNGRQESKNTKKKIIRIRKAKK